MYNITLPILGTRLKQIREHIGYSQAQLAEQLNCKQNAISNLELGKGGSLKLLFQVLNFYSNYVFIDLIFSEKFYLISNTEEDEAQKANYNSVIIEIIRQSEKNYEDAMSNGIMVMRPVPGTGTASDRWSYPSREKVCFVTLPFSQR